MCLRFQQLCWRGSGYLRQTLLIVGEGFQEHKRAGETYHAHWGSLSLPTIFCWPKQVTWPSLKGLGKYTLPTGSAVGKTDSLLNITQSTSKNKQKVCKSRIFKSNVYWKKIKPGNGIEYLGIEHETSLDKVIREEVMWLWTWDLNGEQEQVMMRPRE